MLITPRIMSTKAVDIPKQRVVDVDNYEDYVDKWNTHIHIVFSGDSVGRFLGLKGHHTAVIRSCSVHGNQRKIEK